MLRRLAAAATGAALLSTVFVGTASAQDAPLDGSLDSLLLQAAQAAPSPTLADGLYKKPYSPALYQVATADGVQFSEVISYNRWVADGRPAFSPLPLTFVYSSFTGDSIFALSSLPLPEDDDSFLSTVDPLDYDTWVALGSPTPELLDAPPIVLFTSYAGSPEIFARSYFSNVDPYSVKLTYAEWQALGEPAPETLPISFVKLTWSPDITAVVEDDPETEGDDSYLQTVDYDEWTYLGEPTPTQVQRFEGDQFFFATPGSRVVTYAGPTAYGPVTYAQWVAAGSPKPTDGPR